MIAAPGGAGLRFITVVVVDVDGGEVGSKLDGILVVPVSNLSGSSTFDICIFDDSDCVARC